MRHVPERLRDFPSAILLILALFVASQRLYATSWTPGLEIAPLLTVFAVVLGVTLGHSNYKRRGAIWLAIGYSIFLVPLILGWILYQETAWLERMISLGGRLSNSLILFINAKPVPDPVLFIFFTGIGFWVISLLAGYVLTRRGDFTLAVAPAGVVLFIIQLYDSGAGDRIVILAIYVFLCLILLGRIYYVRKRSFWKEQRVSFSTDSWTDLNLAIPVAAMVLILLVWVMPVGEQPVLTIRHAWENISKPFQQTRKDLSNVIAGLKSNNSGVTTEFYGDILALGTRASVGANIYLTIRAPLTQVDERYYWYVRTYNLYLNNEWHTDFSFDEPLTPSQKSLQLVDSHGNSDEFIFTSTRVNLAVLVTPPHPIWFSRPSILNYTPTSDKSIDPLWFSANPAIRVGEQYTVHALVNNPTILQLQEAGTVYPTWVRDHYLQLPDSLSPQIFDLARQVIKDAKTPYDQANAITEYLRSTITYSPSIIPAPAGIDPLVWFLFNSQTGFCNYYATAEVIMLRALGVPSRMAVGFAQGEFQSPDKYIVRESDAHAWPEVYFPSIGWIEFEPTVSQPTLNHPSGNTNQAGQPVAPLENSNQGSVGNVSPPSKQTETGSASGTQLNPYLPIIGLLVLVVILIIGFTVAYSTGLLDRILHQMQSSTYRPLPILLTNSYAYFSIDPPSWLVRWAYFAGLKPIERSFATVYQSLRWLGHPSMPAQTPAEAAAALMIYLPEIAGEIRSLTREYEYAIFSQKHVDLMAARSSAKIIRRKAILTAFYQQLAKVRAFNLHLFSHNGNGKE